MTAFLGALLRKRGLPRPYAESRPLEIVELELPDSGSYPESSRLCLMTDHRC